MPGLKEKHGGSKPFKTTCVFQWHDADLYVVSWGADEAHKNEKPTRLILTYGTTAGCRHHAR
jgi:hypothetical protein